MHLSQQQRKNSLKISKAGANLGFITAFPNRTPLQQKTCAVAGSKPSQTLSPRLRLEIAS